MRRFLRAFAGLWLASQLVAVVSPLTLFSESFGIDQATCCPGLAPGQVCPMHHKRAGDRTCQMESACAHHDAALLTILATGAVPPSVPAIAFVSESTLSQDPTPDLPPPRA
jgi:hypothetical protein